MKESKKIVFYEIFSALMIGLSIWWQSSIKTVGNIENGYRLAFFGSVIFALLLFSITIAIKSMHFKSLKSYTGELRFCIIFGICLFIIMVINFLTFGGLSGSFEKAGYRAASFMLIFLSICPLPSLIISGIKTIYSKEENKSTKTTLRVICIILILLYVLLAILGVFFRTVTYQEVPYVQM